ncbi:hypothetical protein AB0H43_13765 [Hamadaea sp. NPDC050747]|uniref:hypothetical protein n=1 Tax=Hamadaea sp. NPDC050747 TaxID=3155789 RepID=UPI0033C1820E
MSSPFNPDNRAYRRFLTVIGEHFDVAQWLRDSDQQPVMVTMTDLDSGDMFTVGLMDSVQATAPHILAAIDISGGITAYGPFTGDTAANSHAGTVALSRGDVAATRALPLHRPDHVPPTEAWASTPADLAEIIHAADADGPAAIVVLLHRQQPSICAVGPFPDHYTAATWPLPDDLAPMVRRLTTALYQPSADA